MRKLSYCILILIMTLSFPSQAIQSTTEDEGWLRATFPELRSIQSKDTIFVFSVAPFSIRTQAVINKSGETLFLYRFGSKRDAQTCKNMIKGATLVYGDTTVYVDTKFPVTYYFNADKKSIALYCGADQSVHNKLLDAGYELAGGFGGYFASRTDTIYTDINIIAHAGSPDTVQELRDQWDTKYICIGEVAKIDKIKNGYVNQRIYTVKVEEIIQGAPAAMLPITAPVGVMEEGRTYVLLLSEEADQADTKTVRLVDPVCFSAFEIDDRGYVLPVREYGMKASVSLSAFKKSLQ